MKGVYEIHLDPGVGPDGLRLGPFARRCGVPVVVRCNGRTPEWTALSDELRCGGAHVPYRNVPGGGVGGMKGVEGWLNTGRCKMVIGCVPS